MSKRWFVCAMLAAVFLPQQHALERPDVTFKIFQFPPDKIPRIDGNPDDWSIVPDSYSIGMDQLMDTEEGHGMNHDPKNLDVKVKVGWVKAMGAPAGGCWPSVPRSERHEAYSSAETAPCCRKDSITARQLTRRASASEGITIVGFALILGRKSTTR